MGETERGVIKPGRMELSTWVQGGSRLSVLTPGKERSGDRDWPGWGRGGASPDEGPGLVF